jgi:arylsulfatase A-like enzyme
MTATPSRYEARTPGRSIRPVALVLTAAGLLGASPAPAATNAGAETPLGRRPSVLLILPDQWRGQDLGCMGNPEVRTPHLDRLASQGVLFRNTFANTPVCCPARANILTGKYAHKSGMVANDLRLRESETTLAELLAAQGYRTGFIGKWHLDGGPRLPGFVPPGPRRQGFQFWAANECDHRHFRPTYFRDDDRPIAEERFEPEVWTDRAIEFLKQAGEEPFFLVVSIGPPHDPYGAPERFMKLYDPARLTMRPNWVEGVPGAGRKELAAYHAAMTAVDEQVGRLMRTLDDLGRAGDTIVLFTSDHGDMLGSHGRRLKRKPWEESIRVPGILRYPAKAKQGRTSDALLTHVDLAPTLLALCGLPVPDDMQGADLSAVALGTTDRGPDSAFFQIFVPFAGDGTPHPWRGVRTGRLMYARTEAGPWVLYDLKDDPYELKVLAHDPAHADLRKAMEAKLAAWMGRTGDSWANDSIAPVEDKGRLYRFGTFYTIREYLDWAARHPELAPKD